MSQGNLILRRVVSKQPQLMSDSEMFRPEITFNFKTLPEAKSWQNGKKYHLVLNVEQVGSSKDDARFAIEKVAVYNKSVKKNNYGQNQESTNS